MTKFLKDLHYTDLMSEVAKMTKLENFGNPLHIKGLGELANSINKEALLNQVGIEAQKKRIIGILINRLRFENDLLKFPEIQEEEIGNPIFIVGLPRTGSTMIHRLLSTDINHTSMLWWEGRNPSRLENEERGKSFKRIEIGKEEVELLLKASPDLLKIHPMDAMAPDEEILLLEHSFFSTVPESFMYLPSYSRWIESQDHTTAYEYLKSFLQYLQWQNPSRSDKRWILKTPHHMGYVDVILKVFPGAKIIQTHRNPLDTIPSYCSMVTTLAEPLTDNLDLSLLSNHWEKKLARVMEHCMEVSRFNPKKFIDINYIHLIKSPLHELEKIYEFIDKPFASTTKDGMQKWLIQNKQHKHGQHNYSSANYGLRDEIITKDFSKYIDTYIS